MRGLVGVGAALILGLAASACAASAPQATPTNSPIVPTATASRTQPPPSDTPTRTPPPSATGLPYVPQTNPLTGLSDDPRTMRRAPLLVSITNFPPSGRPQAGLAQAAHVWETSIGQGLTRFLAVYYGGYPQAMADAADGVTLPYDFVMAPIRSGRVAFDDIRAFYPGGLLVTRAASPEVLPQLGEQLTVNNRDIRDVNSAGLTLEELAELPLAPAAPADYNGWTFDEARTPGGAPAPDLYVVYNVFAQYGWTYDPATGQYLRWQDSADGEGELRPHVDRISGDPLAFENLVVLFADHKPQNPAGTIIEIGLRFLTDGFGLLLRDGRVYDIRWSTTQSQFRLMDEDGEPIALKPGRTFFEVFNFQSTWDPVTRTLRYHNPPLPTPTFTATFTPSPTLSPTVTDTPTITPTCTPAP